MIAAQLDSYFTELSFFADLDKGVTYSAGCICVCVWRWRIVSKRVNGLGCFLY